MTATVPPFNIEAVSRRPAAPICVTDMPAAVPAIEALLPSHAVISLPLPNGPDSITNWAIVAGAQVLIWPSRKFRADARQTLVQALKLSGAAQVKLAKLDKEGPDDALEALTRGWDEQTTADWLESQGIGEPHCAELPELEPPPSDELEQEAETPVSPEGSDDQIALAFADLHRDHLRHVAAWRKWLRWQGTHWAFDETLHAFDLSRKLCRTYAAQANKGGKKIAASKTISAVVSLARSDRKLAAEVDQWDRNPWLLNTPIGVIDLKTGNTREPRPEDHLTRLTGTAMDPDQHTPIWASFLATVTAGDDALARFLQRIVGYSLTGETREHALFFCYGTGANGKSVFLNTIGHILGDYQRSAPIETFTASNSERHPTELAMLRGARLVTAVETEEGRRWAESRIKALTGGDKIAARFMRQDYFEFTPQFKLIIAGNHKPGLRSVDEAIRRRFNLIPFTVTIPQDQRDDTLTERLRTEQAGILAWAVEGCMDWQARGLCPPKAVLEATSAYLEAEDATAAWIEAACTRDVNGWETTTALFQSWKEWADKSGEFVGALKRFVQAMETRGFHPERRKYGRGFIGLQINPKEQEPAPWVR